MRTVAVFDMDGTLTDSRQAIWRSYRYAARKLGVPVPDDGILSQHLCGGLPDNCLALFGEEHAEEAVRYYREDYLSHNADDDVTLFPGIKEMLERLHSAGILLGVATMKVQASAESTSEAFGIRNLFDSVQGVDAAGKRTKAQMILECAREVDADRIVMVGDCVQDMLAAKEDECWFVAASYGYGLPLSRCLNLKIPSAATPAEVGDIVLRISKR